MPRPIGSTKTPSYRKHKASGQAIVTIDGKDHYLGSWKSKASEAEYDRLMSLWLANGRRLVQPGHDAAVAEIAAAFLRHAQTYYRDPAGDSTSELKNFKYALRPLVKLFGKESAAQFGPLKLAAVRQSMIAAGLARTNINRMVGRLKHVFKWATEREMIPAAVYQGISTVAGLKAGRSNAKETEPIRPIDEKHVEAILPHVAPPVAAILKLGLLTGARPGELCSMRGCDIDTTGALWVYRPAKHKTMHHGHGREIYLGERCKEVVRPFLKPDLSAHLFSPADAMQWHREQRRQARKTPLHLGNGIGTNRKAKPTRKPGNRYRTESLARAIIAGCDRAFPAPMDAREDPAKLKEWRDANRFHANQLRHTAATRFRKEHGLEVSSLLLGHKHVAVTEIYAEKNVAAAQSVMGKIG